ncbi:hypothetical protein JCM8547_005208 [Rhodosporidiobolus lusitaniae]
MNPLSGSNRLPVSPRRAQHPLPPGRITYTPSFPPPSYLRHASLYADRFYTTPTDDSPYSALGASTVGAGVTAGGEYEVPTSLKKQPSLSDALSVEADTPAPGRDVAREAPLLLPSCWDEDDRCALLELSSDGLSVSFAGSAKYGDRDAAAIRANRPIPPQTGVYYFEVTVVDKGVSGYIGIGLSHRSVPISRLPGWEENSYGYHADDGHAFCCQGTGEPFGPTFTTGDVVGCGVDWTNAGPPQGPLERSGPKGAESQKMNAAGGRLFFTKNGKFLGYAACNLEGRLYPTVGLRTPHESVRVNFGSEPFRFDIDGLVLERKRTILFRIASTSPSPSSLLISSSNPPIPSLLPPDPSERLHDTLQSLISSYLVHNGFAATASAFAQQIRTEREERTRGLFLPSSSSSCPRRPSPPSPADDLISSITASSAIRSCIRSAAIAGQAQLTLQLLHDHYPSVLVEPDDSSEHGGVHFRLRCRVFVEAVLALSKANKDPSASYLVDEHHGESRSSSDNSARDSPTTGSAGEESSPAPPISPSPSPPVLTLDGLLLLGRALDADYSADERPAVREELQCCLGLLAYEDPQREATGRARELLTRREREKVADEVNRAVLLASSLPPVPALEQLYRHTATTIQLAGDLGAGSASMVDLRRELRTV